MNGTERVMPAHATDPFERLLIQAYWRIEDLEAAVRDFVEWTFHGPFIPGVSYHKQMDEQIALLRAKAANHPLTGHTVHTMFEHSAELWNVYCPSGTLAASATLADLDHAVEYLNSSHTLCDGPHITARAV